MLQQDILSFQSKGQVVMMGDFNARCGRLNEWDLLDPHIQRSRDTHPSIKHRRSKDFTVNKMGKNLIDLCEKNGMYILNGRSTTDKHGCFSFRHLGNQHGGAGRSVIDYAAVSKDLFVSGIENKLDFKVIPIDVCPQRRCGGCYDHGPIVTVVGWDVVKGGRNEGPDTTQSSDEIRMRWRPAYRTMYTDIVQTDGVVLGWLARVHDDTLSIQDSCDALTLAVTRAAEVLHSRVGGIFVSNSKNRNQSPMQQSWLSGEAKDIRKKMKDAEKGLPFTMTEVKDLRSSYRKQVKKDRRRFVQEKRLRIRQDMIEYVKCFWNRFGITILSL